MRKLLYLLLLIGSLNSLYGQYSCETAIELDFCNIPDPIQSNWHDLSDWYFDTIIHDNPEISFPTNCLYEDLINDNQSWFYYQRKSNVPHYTPVFALIGVDGLQTFDNQDSLQVLMWGPFDDLDCADLVDNNVFYCGQGPSWGNYILPPTNGLNTDMGQFYLMVVSVPITFNGYIITSEYYLFETVWPELYCQPCEPNAGSLASYPNVFSCQNGLDLNLLIEPEYSSTSDIPPSNIHGYTYVISDTDSGVLLNYTSSPNLTNYAPGTYTVCGLSFGLNDAGDFPTTDGVYTLSDLQDALNENPAFFCGDLTEDCIEVTINASYTNMVIDTSICEGESYLFNGQLLTETGTYDNSGQTVLGCDSTITLNLEVLLSSQEIIEATYCLGESVVHNNITYTSTALDSFDLTSSNGCDSLLIVDVEFIDIQSVIEDLPTGLCSQSSIQLNGNQSSAGSSVTYQWFNDMMPIMTGVGATLDVTANGLYILEVNNGTTCTARDSMVVDNIGLDYSITSDLYTNIDCNSPEITLPININVGTDDISIVWSTLNGQIVGATDLEDITVSQAGQYTIDINNVTLDCSMTKTFEVFEDLGEPTVSVIATEIGCDSPGVLTGSSEDTNDVPFWTGPNVQTPNSWIVQTDVAGPYTLTVTGANGCTTSEEIEVNANQDIPLFTFVEETALDCIDEEAKLTIQLDHEGDYIYDYESNGVPYILSTDNLEIIFTEAALLTLTITDQDNDCSYTSSVNIEDNQVGLTAEVETTDVICSGDNNGGLIVTNVEGGEAPYLYKLSTSDVWQSSPFFAGLNAGNHVVQIEDINGCSEEIVFEISEPQANSIEIVANTEILDLGDSTILEVLTYSPLGIDTIIWTGEDIQNHLSQEMISVAPTHSTNYSATLIDQAGCSVQVYFHLQVNSDRDIFIPTIFTPNLDGINDIFLIQGGSQVKEIRYLHIMDRWGGRVYSQTHFAPNDPNYAWDGRVDNQNLQMGVYMYALEVEFIDGYIKDFKSDVTLMR